MDFMIETLESWDRLHAYAQHGWLYRGQREAGWSLKTALERLCDRRNVPLGERAGVEYRLCREFRRGYHQYALHVPPRTSMLEWLALMQHHGSPTRILDFTYSIYVAAYFALEDSDGDCAVWGLDGPWALQKSVDLLQHGGKTLTDDLQKTWDEGDDEIFADVFLKEPVALCACPMNPFRLNERLRIQMGIFMVPGRVDASFEDNVRALPGYEQKAHILKIVIPSAFRNEALRTLFDMGLSRRTLFPGLDGYAQSLAVYSPALNPIRWE